MKRFFLSLLCALSLWVVLVPTAKAEYVDLAEKGLSARDMGNDMPHNLWLGLSYQSFLSLLSGFNLDFANPMYRRLLIDLLLAEHKGFYAPAPEQDDDLTSFKDIKYTKQELTEDQALVLLKTRFEMLYKLGAFDEAERLYQEIFSRTKPTNETLLLYGLYPLLIQGNLGGFCLDIETIKSADNYIRIQDLKTFCHNYFDKENADSPQEESLEGNQKAGTSDTHEAVEAEQQELTKLDNFKALRSLNILLQTQNNISREAFESSSLLEKLLIHAMGRIDARSFNSINGAMRDISLESLKILSYQNATNEPKQSCLMNKAYFKGVISANALLLFYQSIPMAPGALEKTSYARQSLHDCQKPAWYIHYINQANDDKERTKRLYESLNELSKYHPGFLEVYTSVFKNLSPESLTTSQRWSLGAALVKQGYELSDEWRKSVRTNNEKGLVDSQESNSKVYISPDWYLQILQHPENFDEKEFFIWSKTGFSDLSFSTSFAPSRPLTLLKIMLKLKLYEETLFHYYEKFFLLTFSRNYVIYNDSLISRVSASIDNEHIGKSMLLLLRIFNDQKPADIYPQYGNYLLDLLSRIGYKQYARDFIVDTLSVGKN